MFRIYAFVLAGIVLWGGNALAEQKEGTLNDVWMRYGGARLYYDALVHPTQVNLNGARWQDPAYTVLPPLYAPEKKTVRRSPAKASAAPAAVKPQASAPKVAPVKDAKPSTAAGAAAPASRSGAALTPPVPAPGVSPFVEPLAPTGVRAPESNGARNNTASAVPAGAAPQALDASPRH